MGQGVSGPAAAGRGMPNPSAAGRHRMHNATPEEDYRTRAERVSDSPDEGVRYMAGGREAGNDPDAKPACGTPRAERSAAAVVSFLR
jgi:hypothetical protein